MWRVVEFVLLDFAFYQKMSFKYDGLIKAVSEIKMFKEIVKNSFCFFLKYSATNLMHCIVFFSFYL